MRCTALTAAILLLAAVFSTTSCMSAFNSTDPLPPLIGAARTGDTAQMTVLIASGVDVNQRGGVNNWTPLMHAVHKNQLEAVRVLINAGADLNATAGARGRDTALSLAVVQNHPEIAALLRAHGAKEIR